jgi:hypothetical protein
MVTDSGVLRTTYTLYRFGRGALVDAVFDDVRKASL